MNPATPLLPRLVLLGVLLAAGCGGKAETILPGGDDSRTPVEPGFATPEDLDQAFRRFLRRGSEKNGGLTWRDLKLASFRVLTPESQLAYLEWAILDLEKAGDRGRAILARHGLKPTPGQLAFARNAVYWQSDWTQATRKLVAPLADREAFYAEALRHRPRDDRREKLLPEPLSAAKLEKPWLERRAVKDRKGRDLYLLGFPLLQQNGRWFLQGPYELLIEHMVQRFVDDLKKPEVLTRRGAVGALGQMGPHARDAVPALAALLEGKNDLLLPPRLDDPPKLWRGQEQFPGATRRQNELAPLRADTAGSLGRMGVAALDALPSLERALQDGYATVRSAALEALSRIAAAAAEKPEKGNRSTLRFLLLARSVRQRCTDSDAGVRQAARSLLQQLRRQWPRHDWPAP